MTQLLTFGYIVRRAGQTCGSLAPASLLVCHACSKEYVMHPEQGIWPDTLEGKENIQYVRSMETMSCGKQLKDLLYVLKYRNPLRKT